MRSAFASHFGHLTFISTVLLNREISDVQGQLLEEFSGCTKILKTMTPLEMTRDHQRSPEMDKSSRVAASSRVAGRSAGSYIMTYKLVKVYEVGFLAAGRGWNTIITRGVQPQDDNRWCRANCGETIPKAPGSAPKHINIGICPFVFHVLCDPFSLIEFFQSAALSLELGGNQAICRLLSVMGTNQPQRCAG